MNAPLKGRCIVGNQEHPFQFDDWLPYKIPDIVIAINPHTSFFESILPLGRTLWLVNWRYESKFFNMCFLPPDGTCVQSIDQWASKSPGSSSLYPWWCSLRGDNGAPPVDLICQIQPRGVSSEHKHQQERGVDVVEEYGPVWSDGETLLRVGNSGPKPLLFPQSILPGQSHQLVRHAPGFSIHLLLMRSYKFRFPDRSGHIPCSRISRHFITS